MLGDRSDLPALASRLTPELISSVCALAQKIKGSRPELPELVDGQPERLYSGFSLDMNQVPPLVKTLALEDNEVDMLRTAMQALSTTQTQASLDTVTTIANFTYMKSQTARFCVVEYK